MRVLSLVLVLAMAAVLAGTSLRRSAMRTFLESRTYEDVYYIPEPSALPLLSLGYREALADLIWIQALVYTGSEFIHRGDLGNVFRYADAIIMLDPKFRAAYRWAGTLGIYRPKGVTIEDHRRTIRYLEAAVREFPEDGELRWELGATMAYEIAPLLPLRSAERERWKVRAREQFFEAARRGAGPSWIGVTAAMDDARAGSVERALTRLRELHAMAPDRGSRRRIERRIATLEGEAAAEAMRSVTRDFERRHRAEFPYVSEDLFLLLSPRVRD
jgi:hypothetical protein